ncbi:MAG: M28 family peptidase, partial [Chloroflexota bacterium]
EYGYRVADDHRPLLDWGVPAALLIDLDYAYWHTRQDTVDKISAESLQRVGHVLETLLEDEPLIYQTAGASKP